MKCEICKLKPNYIPFSPQGPLIVSIQELDGSFPHTVQVEDTVSHHELPCHSKSRRNKKKKIPLCTGEEVGKYIQGVTHGNHALKSSLHMRTTKFHVISYG